MNKRGGKAIFWVVLAVLCLVLSSCAADEPTKKVCIKDICVQAEIADSEAKKTRGLMYRESLAWESGMLFIFDEEALHSFWMKNTLIPLDMIWIDSDKNIVDITQNALPCKEQQECKSIIPTAEVKYVLEVNSGFSEKNKIEVGDKAVF